MIELTTKQEDFIKEKHFGKYCYKNSWEKFEVEELTGVEE